MSRKAVEGLQVLLCEQASRTYISAWEVSGDVLMPRALGVSVVLCTITF